MPYASPTVLATSNPGTAAVVALVQAGPTTVYQAVLSNVSATQRYVKLYNKATAPVAASDVPVMTIAVPANGTVILPCNDLGIPFPLGLGYGISGLAPDTDATALTAAKDIKVLVTYI